MRKLANENTDVITPPIKFPQLCSLPCNEPEKLIKFSNVFPH